MTPAAGVGVQYAFRVLYIVAGHRRKADLRQATADELKKMSSLAGLSLFCMELMHPCIMLP